ncbi:short-chain dehydrogenases reductases family protein [Furfurilactobacillus rossiae DSM 15814]|uniref:Short-chain dehydrogenases reductases family protein n=2 Tax=Furfurilactobacillus rossiae TaxID=231049 RepID=A0A0R1RBS8_9LACO|nr:short-chain dehydrogenases reductases family protein [Furfurilactobacillus rossiae DSM 15814]
MHGKKGEANRMKKTIVIVGAGAGLGHHIAERFGREGFNVVLMARNASRLAEYVASLKSQGIDADYFVVDVASNASIQTAFAELKRKYNRVDVLVYNVAMMSGNRPLELTPAELLEHYQTDVVGALAAAQQVISMQKDNREGTLLFTGGGFSSFPAASNTTMSLDKAALRNLALVLAEELEPMGIFAGIVTIMGTIDQDEHFSATNIADQYWQLYTRRKSHEIIYD